MNPFKKYFDEKYTKIAFYTVTTLLITFVLGLIVYSLKSTVEPTISFIGAILTPLVLGIVLAYLFAPLVEFFEKKLFSRVKPNKRRAPAVALTFLLVILVILLVLATLVITVTNSVSNIDFNNLMAYVQSLETDFSKFWSVIESKLAEYNINLGKVGGSISKVFNNISSGASTLLFANIFAIYFLLDSHIKEYWSAILDLIVSEETRAKLREFAADADRVFSGYIRGQSIDALLVGVLVTIALLIIGVPYAVVIGLLTGFGNLIPYVGPVIGFASLVIICLSEGSLLHLALGAGVLLLVMAIDGNIINPKLLSDNVEIHPVLVIVALIAGGQIGGIVGMLVAVPVAALLKLQFEKLVAKRRAQLEQENNNQKSK